MNIQILSDLHLEFHPDDGKLFLDSLDPKDVDVLVVPGDICTLRLLAPAIRSLCDRYARVAYVAGNHEYYNSSPAEVHRVLRELGSTLCNFHWLRNNTEEIAEIHFAGTTLWFPYDPDNVNYERELNDFDLIRGFRTWVYGENEQAIEFLEREAQHADVVVTHHLPSVRCIAPRFEADRLNRFFLCELDELIATAQPELWIHGHTHESVEARVGRTRILCNPLGYMPRGNGDFHRKLTARVSGAARKQETALWRSR